MRRIINNESSSEWSVNLGGSVLSTQQTYRLKAVRTWHTPSHPALFSEMQYTQSFSSPFVSETPQQSTDRDCRRISMTHHQQSLRLLAPPRPPSSPSDTCKSNASRWLANLACQNQLDRLHRRVGAGLSVICDTEVGLGTGVRSPRTVATRSGIIPALIIRRLWSGVLADKTLALLQGLTTRPMSLIVGK